MPVMPPPHYEYLSYTNRQDNKHVEEFYIYFFVIFNTFEENYDIPQDKPWSDVT